MKNKMFIWMFVMILLSVSVLGTDYQIVLKQLTTGTASTSVGTNDAGQTPTNMAQQFSITNYTSLDVKIVSVMFNQKYGTPTGAYWIAFENDSAGSPSATATSQHSQIAFDPNSVPLNVWSNYTFNETITLTQSDDYWIVMRNTEPISGSSTGISFHTDSDGTAYAGHSLYRQESGGAWGDRGVDMAFIIYAEESIPEIPDTLNVSNATQPANNTQFSLSKLNMNVTLNASISGNCSLFVNNTFNQSTTYPAGAERHVELNLSFDASTDKAYTYFFSCRDNTTWENTTTKIFYIDSLNPSITFNYPNPSNTTYAVSPMTPNITISDNNLYSYSLNYTYSNGTLAQSYYNNTLTGITEYTISDKLTTNASDTFTAEVRVCDGHTGNEIFFNAEVLNNELIFDNGEVIIYLKNKLSTADISFTKKTDRYNFGFDVLAPSNVFEYVVKSMDYIDIMDTEYAGHLITGDKWIDFESKDIKDVSVKRINDNEVEVKVTTLLLGTGITFDSIGELNCVDKHVSFTIDAISPIVTNILPLNNSADTDGEVSFVFNVNENANCTLYLNGLTANQSNNGTGDLTIPYTFEDRGNYTWRINCSDLADNIGLSGIYNLEVTLSENVLTYGYFDTDAKCVLDEELAYVIGYFFIIVLILVLFFVNLLLIKIPIISILLGVAEIIVTLNFYPCTWILGTIFTLFGVIMVFYELILLYRSFTSL